MGPRKVRAAEGIAKAKTADRLIAGVKGLDGGAAFAEGHDLDPERAAKMPARPIGRTLTLPQAKQLLARLERKGHQALDRLCGGRL
jgi:hypothetical protein